MERKVVKIIKPDYSILKKTRVAVYCRVSTAHLEQMNSLENQIDYFKSLVQQNLQWTLVDIYSDVQSGKNNGRAEFQRMIQDFLAYALSSFHITIAFPSPLGQ